jgi:TPR repeat protein
VPADAQADLEAGLEYYRQLDFYKAQYHLLKAANSANAEAECALGDIFADERNPNHDVKYSAEWYEKAAENGHSRAQWLIGASYLEGVGANKSLDKAKHWLQKSADQGDAYGQYGLAGYYFTIQDYKSSAEWLKKAAAQGHEEAREMLERLGV